MPLSMTRVSRVGVVALLMAATVGGGASNGASEPSSSPEVGAWPTAGELRASLAESGYSFTFEDPGSPWPGAGRWTGGRPDIPGTFAWPAELSVRVDDPVDAPATVRLLVGGDARLIELVDVGTALGLRTSLLTTVSDAVRGSVGPGAASCPFAEWPVAGGRLVLWRGSARDAADVEVALQPRQDEPAAGSAAGASPGPGARSDPGGGSSQEDAIPASADEACPPTADGGMDATPPTPVASPSGTSPITVVSVEAREFGFQPPALTIPASGTSRIVVTDAGRIVHNLTVDGLDIQVVVSPGGSGEVTIVDPPPGTYQFYCSISGHKEAGMVGTLTVE